MSGFAPYFHSACRAARSGADAAAQQTVRKLAAALRSMAEGAEGARRANCAGRRVHPLGCQSELDNTFDADELTARLAGLAEVLIPSS
jgi:hypothetical protein